MNILKTLSRAKVQIPGILFLFVIYSILNFHLYGIKIVNDSTRYLEYARILKEGFFFDQHNFWYIGYAAYILVIQSMGGDLTWIILSQYFLAGVGLLAIYFTSLNIWRSPPSAFFTCLSLIVFIDLGQWMSYVLAESVYASFTCITLYFLSILLKKDTHSFSLSIIAAIIIIVTALIKPTGIALLGSLVAVLTIAVCKQFESRHSKAGVIIISSVLVILLANRMLTTYQVLDNYHKGEIIYGITTLPDRPEYRMMSLVPPKELYVSNESTPPLLKIILFIVHHPLYWFHLFAAKVLFLIFHVRPYWSFAHNVYSLAILLPSYYLFVKAIKFCKSRVLTIFSLVYILMHVMIVGITSADWDGRFLVPLLPVIFLFSGHGLFLASQKLLPKKVDV